MQTRRPLLTSIVPRALLLLALATAAFPPRSSVAAQEIDTTPPETTIISGPPDGDTTGSATFTFTADDPEATFLCSLDGSGWAACESGVSYNGLAVGPHQFGVFAVDTSGNADQSPALYDWSIAPPPDTSPPTAPTVAATAIGPNQIDVTWSGAADDVGVVTYDVYRDGGLWASDLPGSGVSDTSVAPNTTYAYTVVAKDAAGNASLPGGPALATTPAPPDTTPPDTAITSGPADPTDSTQASFEFWSPDDAGATFECSLDGVTFSPCTTGITYPDLTEGVYVFTVRAVDSAGNADPTPASHSWTVAWAPLVDNFESNDLAFWTDVDGLIVQSAEVATGNYAARATSAGAEAQAVRTLSLPQVELFYRVKFKLLDRGDNPVDLLRLYNTAGAPLLTLSVDGDGRLGYRNDVDGSTRTSTVAVTEGVWHEVEIRLVVVGLGGQTEVWYDGNRLDDLSRSESTGTAAIGHVAVGDGTTNRSFDVAFDDVKLDTSFITPEIQAPLPPLDTTAPETTIDSGPDDPTSSTSASFTFSADEAGATFECELDGGGFQPCASPADYGGLAEGPHTFQVRATDGAGNTDATPAAASWTVDTTAPTVTSDAPADGATGVAWDANVEATFAEPIDPATLNTATFTLVDQASGTPVAATVSYDEATQTTTLDPDADLAPSTTYEATVTTGARDRAGNPLAAAHTWSFTTAAPPDTAAPDTTIDAGPAGAVNTTSASFAFSADEPDATFECVLDDGDFAACSSPTSFDELADGTHTFRVRAVDTSGNIDASPAERTWTVDTTAPETTIDDGPSGSVNSTSATIAFSSEPGSTFECELDGGGFQSCVSPVNLADLGDGAHSFAVRAADAAGNVDASPATSTWTVDATAPETTIDSGPDDGATTGPSVTFAFSSDDADATFTCSLDGAAFTSCSSPTTYTETDLGAGSHTFQVQATDAAGNTDATPASRTWTVDATAPTVTGVAPAAGATGVAVGANVAAVFSEAMDPISLTASTFTLVVQGGSTPIEAAVTYDAAARRATLDPAADLAPNSTYTATVTTGAKDLAGNPLAAAHTWSFTTAGTSTPSFAAEADAEVRSGSPNTNYGGSNSLVSDGDPVIESYLRFTVSGVDGAVTGAKLRLYNTNGTTAAAGKGPAVYPAGNDWTEAGITWNTKPARTSGSPTDVKGAITVNTWVEFDVTALVAGNGTYTFNLAQVSSDAVVFYSKDETANPGLRPQLVLTVQDTGSAIDTTITSGPADPTNSTSATFAFSSADPGATFECALDGAAFAACTSPKDYVGLADGGHRFEVRAVDAAGNADASPAVWTWTIDATAPAVASTTPADGATGVPRAVSASVTFSEAMDPAGLTGDTFTLLPEGGSTPIAAAVTYDAAARTAVLDPDVDLEPNSTYTATVTTGAKDLAGNGLAADFAWSFRTSSVVTTTLAVDPVADARVNSAQPNKNFGTISLLTDGDLVAESYLRFTVTGVTGTVSRATLRLHAFDGTPDGPAVYPADNAWNENTVTWNTRPARTGAALADVGAIASNTWVEFDVTALVAGDGTYTFNLAQSHENAAYFYSREGTDPTLRPQLVVTSEDTSFDTTITSGPADPTNSTSATFAFSSDDSGATFECALDGAAWTACSSPKNYTGLVEGGHAFQVRALSSATGRADLTPASWNWAVDLTAPTAASVAPEDGATGVGTAVRASVTFSEEMDPATLTTATFTLTPQGSATPVAATVSYDAATRTATLAPDAALTVDTTYTATVKTGAKDRAGNGLTTDFDWSFTTAASEQPVTIIAAAEADAWVEAGQPGANHGGTSPLIVDKSPETESYLRFTVTGGGGTVTSAKLRLYATNGTTNGPVVYAAGNEWTESGITWSNKPARTGAVLADTGAFSSNTWVEYDVIGLVTGGGTYTFNLVADSSDGADFVSREGTDPTRRPQLVVSFNGLTVSANPPGGNYSTAQSVTLTASDSTATIHYTIDGSEPTTDSPQYSEPITIATDTTLKFFAVTSNGDSSLPKTEVYSISSVGFRDFAYGSGTSAPTAKEGQSKLWYHDGSWWGALFNPTVGDFFIYRLDTATQTWSNTGTLIDIRNMAKIDVLWDASSGKLYTVAATNTANGAAQVRRFSYLGGGYSLDAGFPVTVNSGPAEDGQVTIAKDTTGKLWITYAPDSGDNRIYVNRSLGDDAVWGTPFVIPAAGSSVNFDDLPAIVAFGSNIGVMWSNQSDDRMYFAVHADGAPDGSWTGEVAYDLPGNAEAADDHINLKADSAGRVYAAAKTSLNAAGEPLIHLLVRQPGGGWSSHTWATAPYNHTRPTVVIDEQGGQVYLFASSPCCSGGKIYYKSSSLSNISFPDGLGTPIIVSELDTTINNVTSTKQTVSGATGLVILAGDDATTSRFYLHNYLPLASPLASGTTLATVTTDGASAGGLSGFARSVRSSLSPDALAFLRSVPVNLGDVLADRRVAEGLLLAIGAAALFGAGTSKRSSPVRRATHAGRRPSLSRSRPGPGIATWRRGRPSPLMRPQLPR